MHSKPLRSVPCGRRRQVLVRVDIPHRAASLRAAQQSPFRQVGPRDGDIGDIIVVVDEKQRNLALRERLSSSFRLRSGLTCEVLTFATCFFQIIHFGYMQLSTAPGGEGGHLSATAG